MIMLAAVLLAGASPAAAKPKRRDAKLAFDRGVAAYKKNSFVAASAALAKSFELERDVDTLFAWAQAERKLDHCDKAIDLYEKLLAFDLPAANRQAVDVKLEECRAIVAESTPKVEPAPAEPARIEPPRADPAPGAVEPVVVAPPRAAAEPADRRAWYKDPVALALLGGGVVASGIGAGLLVSARSLDSDSKTAFQGNHYDDAQRLADQAKSRGNIGLITVSAGGALVIGGVVWIALHRGSSEQRTVTGWLAPGGGGLAVAGGF
jgi:tetratricopeptide (TPR) repeat protein